jgi:hypothetical protein
MRSGQNITVSAKNLWHLLKEKIPRASNIKFIMEMKRDGHPRFLHIDMYRRPDGALGYKVY